MILHISNDYSYSKVYKNLYKELDKYGVEQTIYHPLRDNNHRGNNQFEFVNKNSKLTYSSFLLKKYHRILFRLKVQSLYKDLVKQVDLSKIKVSYPTTLFSDGAIAYKLFKNHKIPYVVAIRNTDVNLFLKYRADLTPLMHKILENADKIIFISEGLKTLFFKNKFVKKHIEKYIGKTVVISNGVEDIWLDNLHPYQRFGRKKILFVGRFDSNKNIESVINVLIQLKTKYPDIRLNLVGGGGNKNEIILNLIKENSTWINYLGFVQDQNELMKIFRENDYFVMPSKFETFGLVYIEALSQGMPILYTKNQGVYGMFNDKVGIASCPDEESLKISLENLINRNDYDLSEINFDKFRWSSIAEQHIKIFEQISK